MYVEPWWDSAFQTSGWGWTDLGLWERGIFRVDLSVEGTLVAIGEFQVRCYPSREHSDPVWTPTVDTLSQGNWVLVS